MEHFQTTRINLLVRKVIGEFGKHLGLLDPYDLFFHTKPEIEEIASESLPAEYFEKIAERKKQHIAVFWADSKWTFGDPNDGFEDNNNI